MHYRLKSGTQVIWICRPQIMMISDDDDTDMIIRENQQCFAEESPSPLISCVERSRRTDTSQNAATIDRLSLARRRPLPADHRTRDLAVAEGLNWAKYWGIIGWESSG